jgi:S1-C subfamily serine protease
VGGPAADAGVQQGDVVTAVDGEPVESGADLRAAIEAHEPGDTIELRIQRDGDTVTETVELGERPATIQ